MIRGLQDVLAANTADSGHHPIVCSEVLHYHEDGGFECPHMRVGSDDRRTQFCLNNSIALLILEQLERRAS